MLTTAANNHPLAILADDGETVIATIPAGTTPARIVTTTTPAPEGGHELVTGTVTFQGFESLPEPADGALVIVSIATAAAYVAAVRAGEVPARSDLVIAGRNVVRRLDSGRTEIVGCVGLTAVSMSDRDMVNVSKREYEELLRRDRKLRALENGGVDNWEWYGEALSSMDDEEDD